MKPIYALLVAALLGWGVTACGDSNVSGQASARIPSGGPTDYRVRAATATSHDPKEGYLKSDGDQDGDDHSRPVRPRENDDMEFLDIYGKKASATDTHAISDVIKRYYTAAAAGDATTACALLSSTLVSGLTGGQSKSTAGPNNTCSAVVSPLLVQQKQRLATDNVATMRVIEVRAKNDIGLAVTAFKAAPISTMVVKRNHRTWKVDGLFDSEMR